MFFQKAKIFKKKTLRLFFKDFRLKKKCFHLLHNMLPASEKTFSTLKEMSSASEKTSPTFEKGNSFQRKECANICCRDRTSNNLITTKNRQKWFRILPYHALSPGKRLLIIR